MSLVSRLLNMFAAPSEAFDDIKDKPVNNANWVTPALMIMFAGWFAALLIFSQDNLKLQMKEVREKAIQKQLEKQHLSREEIDKRMAAMEQYGDIGTIASAFCIPIIAGFVPPFLWGLIFWVVGARILGGHFPYMKAVEAVGLASMIDFLDTIVRALMVVAMGNIFAAPSLAMLIKDWNPENKVHALLGYVNIMTFWLLAVRAVGISRLSKVSFVRAALWVFGIWAGYSALKFGFGVAMQHVFGKMGGGH
jgi:hypothetical protein